MEHPIQSIGYDIFGDIYRLHNAEIRCVNGVLCSLWSVLVAGLQLHLRKTQNALNIPIFFKGHSVVVLQLPKTVFL